MVDLSEDHSTRYETYARGVKLLLFFAGLWPGPVPSKIFRYIAIIHVMTCISTSSAVLNFVFSHITNLGLATKGLGIGVGFYIVILKVNVFAINRSHLVKLHDTLETNFRRDMTNPKLQSILLSPLKFFYRPTLWLTASTCAVITIFLITPPISISIQKAHGVSPIKYRLPFPSQYPFIVVGNGIIYMTLYFIEICAGCAVALVTAATDALFGFYIFQMTSQLRILSYRMKNLKATEDYRKVMKECALRHRTLIECCQNLERVYGPIILCMLVNSAIIMCANIFQASQVRFDKAILAFAYIIMKLLQSLLYGWYGSFLTTESEAFRESIYCSGWPGSGDMSFMSNIRIMLLYKPLILTACHYSVISLDMFIGITNTALSYFFLLRTLDENK